MSLLFIDATLLTLDGRGFIFDRVLRPSDMNDEVWRLVRLIINSVNPTRDVLVLSYGATGLGKSFTMKLITKHVVCLAFAKGDEWRNCQITI